MTTINLYEVFNVESNCSEIELKKAYKKMVKKYHPDNKHGDAEMYELITESYNKINTPTKRKKYDRMYKMNKRARASHMDMKLDYESYIEKAPLKSKDQAKLDFQKAQAEMNKKHGISAETNIFDIAMDKKESSRRLEELMYSREQDEIELQQENMFADSKFDNDKFQALWEKKHMSNDSTNFVSSTISNDLMEQGNYSGPRAFNVGGFGNNGYFNYSGNYDDIYDTGDQSFNSQFGNDSFTINKDDIDNLTDDDINDYRKRRDEKALTNDELKKLVNERKSMDDFKCKFSEFKGIPEDENSIHGFLGNYYDTSFDEICFDVNSEKKFQRFLEKRREQEKKEKK